MKQSSYKIFPPRPQPGSVSRNGWWALWAQKRRRKRAQGAGGSDPGFVPDDMQLWLQASSVGTTFGDSVSYWQDDSGNGNDATQDAESMQPTFDEVTFAGKTFPILRFDTVDDGMETPLVIGHGRPFSVFVMWRLASPDVFSGAILSSSSLDWSVGNLNGLMLCFFEGWTANSPVNASDFYLVEARIVPGTSPTEIYINGVRAVITPGGGSSAPEQVMLGASGANGYPGNCDCAEILIYDRFVTGTEADGVRAYFQSRYNYLKQ